MTKIRDPLTIEKILQDVIVKLKENDRIFKFITSVIFSMLDRFNNVETSGSILTIVKTSKMEDKKNRIKVK